MDDAIQHSLLAHRLTKSISSPSHTHSWGSQAPAQGQNLKESLAGTGIKVKVGLRPSSASWQLAQSVGFTEKDGKSSRHPHHFLRHNESGESKGEVSNCC